MSEPTAHRALMNYTLDRISKGDQRGINVSAAHYAWLGNALAWNERENASLAAAIDELRREVQEWEECALYDPTMEGPSFKGWNRSALDRCRHKIEARAGIVKHCKTNDENPSNSSTARK